MQDPHVTDLIPAYALGALEPDELDRADRHLEDCAQCQALAREMMRVADELLLAAPPLSAPPATRERVLARVRALPASDETGAAGGGPNRALGATRPLAPANPFARFWRLLVGEPEPGDLGDQEDELDRALRDLLLDPECYVTAVAGTPEAPNASARLVASPRRPQGVLLANGLRAPGPGRVYQVWLLRDGQPVPNRLFTVDRRGRGVSLVRMGRDAGGFDTVAVTPEPEGGSPGPTGPIVLAGSLPAAS